MDDIIEEIKQRIDITDLIEESGFGLQRRHGRYLKAQEHDSLVIDTHNQAYHWNSQGEHGDIFNWVQNRNKGWDFRQALEYLAKKANVRLPEKKADLQQRLAARAQEDAFEVAARMFHRWLLKDEEALGYARARGFSDETIESAQLGFSGRATAAELKEMGDEFALHGVDPASKAAVAVTGFKGDVPAWLKGHELSTEEYADWVKWKMIPGMMGRKRFVYTHQYRGRITTLSGRNILGDEKGKGGNEIKSYNLPVALGGSRRPYFNWVYGPSMAELVIVEGQADAVTLGQWGIPAMATAGTSWKDYEELFKNFRERHESIYLAMDADEAGLKMLRGQEGEFPLANVLGPMLRIVRWPQVTWKRPDGKEKTSKDANDWLQYFVDTGADGEQDEQVRAVLDEAKPIVLLAAKYAGELKGAARDRAVKRAASMIAGMDRTLLAAYRSQLADAIQYPIREFNNLVATERKEKTDDGDKPVEIVETLGGWYPLPDGEKGWLIEYLYNLKTQKASLAYRDPEGNIGMAPYLDISGVRYVPVTDDDIIKGGGVLFASDLGPAKPTRELVAMVELFIKRYFLLDNPFEYRLASYYVLLTWVFDCFSALPYLRAQGDTNTGKSELMLRIGYICYRLVISTGASSTAALKFALDQYRGTIFMDEIDIADKFDERIVIMNVGAMRDQAKVWNMVEVSKGDGTRGYRASMANVYGPKLITMYGRFSDPATEGRCLTFRLVEKEPWELMRRNIPTEKTGEFYLEAATIRNLLMRWRLQTWQPRIELSKDMIDLGVSTRINQVTMPLKQLARDDPDLMKEIQAFVQSLNDDLVLERSMSLEARVMDAIVAVLEDDEFKPLVIDNELEGLGRVKYIAYKHLADVANRIMDEMNLGERAEAEESDGRKKRKGITSPTVGSICRKDLRLPVKRMGKGFVVILDPERVEVLKLKYGLDKVKYEPMTKPTPPPEPEEAAPQEPSQGELLSDEPVYPDEPFPEDPED